MPRRHLGDMEVDYHGDPRTSGGDPVAVEVLPLNDSGSESAALDSQIEDIEDGTYKIKFRPPAAGRYVLKVSVFERPIKDCPLFFDVTEHNNPTAMYGSRGLAKTSSFNLSPLLLMMLMEAQCMWQFEVKYSGAPIQGRETVRRLVNKLRTTGSINATIPKRKQRVLTPDLEFVRHIENEGLAGRSCTGIAVSNNGLVVVNWRTKTVTELSPTHGETLSKFSHNAFQEPIDVAVDRGYGHILVADNGLSCVFVFDSDGKILFQVGKKGSQRGYFNLISSVTVGPSGEIIVADSRIQVFSAKGDFLEELYPEGKGRGRYGGVVVDGDDRIVATRSEKNRNYIQVLRFTGGTLISTIDSHDSRLKRPSGSKAVKALLGFGQRRGSCPGIAQLERALSAQS
ncbi:hypothetical protein ANN_07197 [Periplaneta americana]|uniref:Uncharacterized protein n=1 Tax=Periplaneta americana TaxID=6978 RepID=A0ABQ8TGA3_PERAM|nr:hypothetical protein ANN_07197 [Periplaneta americana]